MPRRMLSRLLISAAIRAKGAQFVMAQGMPIIDTKMVAVVVVWGRKVSQVQMAKRTWERSQARRSVSQRILGDGKRDQRRVRRLRDVEVWMVGMEGIRTRWSLVCAAV